MRELEWWIIGRDHKDIKPFPGDTMLISASKYQIEELII